MPLFEDIVKIFRRGKNNRSENALTKEVTKRVALKDIANDKSTKVSKPKVDPKAN